MNRFSVRLIADTDEKRARGLMFASPLAEDEVALFVFPHAERYAFWNKNVEFGLDLAFLDENGRIVDLKSLEAGSEQSVRPDSAAKFVVEASRGTFDRLSIGKGDSLLYRDSGLSVVRSSSQVKGRRTGNTSH